MARPKLPAAQRKGMVNDCAKETGLNESLAAVAHLRGTTKSGLVSQYAAEQSRLEQERDRRRFDAGVEDTQFQREAKRRKNSAAQPERRSDAADGLKASTDQRPLATSLCFESRP